MHQLLCKGVWLHAAALHTVPRRLGAVQDPAPPRQDQVLQVHIGEEVHQCGQTDPMRRESGTSWMRAEGLAPPGMGGGGVLSFQFLTVGHGLIQILW